MAHYSSKGYFVAELKKAGIIKHPVTQEKLEKYRTSELRYLYFKHIIDKE